MLSRFHLIPERHGQTDRHTDRFAISISRVSVQTVVSPVKQIMEKLLRFVDKCQVWTGYNYILVTDTMRAYYRHAAPGHKQKRKLKHRSLLPVMGPCSQLSQRDHAMLRVTEYFVKSLKVTEGHDIREGNDIREKWEGRSLLVFRCNYLFSYRFWDIQR